MNNTLYTLNNDNVSDIKFRDIAQRSKMGGPFYLLGFLASALSSEPARQHGLIIALMSAGFVALLLARLMVAGRVAVSSSVDNDRGFRVICSIYGLSALLWTLASGWLYSVNPAIDLTITINIMATAGIVAGGITAVAAYYSLLRVYCWLMSLPLAIAAMVLLDGPGNWVVGLFIASYGIFMGLVGKQQHLTCSQAFSDNLTLSAQAEELELARAAAESAVQAKTDFLAAMTHEIRTPMSGVLGMAQLLAMSELTEEQQQQLAVINKAGSSLLCIIDNILDYSKLKDGQLRLDQQVFNPAKVVAEVELLLSTQAQEQGIQLTSRIISDNSHEQTPEAVPAYVVGDPIRLHQILYNLVGNAIKFTRQGEVAITLSAIDRADKRCVLLLEVRDTGVGIAVAEQKKIFAQFYQVNPYSPDVRGSGLGLSITQNLVELMGGTISLQSMVDVGTVVKVELPFELAAGPAAATPALANRDLLAGRKKQPLIDVLLVEDNKTNLMIYEKFLTQLDCRVDTAETGLVALQKVKQQDYAAIFMDCNMPEMDGFAATRAIRQRERETSAAPTPVIALTAHVQEAVKQQCLQAGMNAFLSKPFLFADLAGVIDTVRDGLQHRDGSV